MARQPDKDPGPIAPEGHAVMRDPPGQPGRRLEMVALPAHPDVIRLGPNGDLTLQAPDDPKAPVLMVRDERGVWHAVLLPPGTLWELRKKGPTIWQPGMPS